MEKIVRTRIAPSNTGMCTIGNIRTALFNYLFAKKHGGEFLLRIEDTDQKRSVPGSEEYFIKCLNWLGISPDNSLTDDGKAKYVQSKREYKSYIDILLNNGNAYYAFDSETELEDIRKKMDVKGKKPFSYNSFSRMSMKNSLSLSVEETKERLDRGDTYVIRFKTPVNREVKFVDLVCGEMSFNTNSLDDKVIFKSSGLPTYHGGVIVDDHLLGITHVIRGNEWLASTPTHILMYEAFGWEIPEFAHLPLLLDKNGVKISKRKAREYDFPVFLLECKYDDGDLIQGFKELGYSPDAVFNALSFLGWNPGTEQEILSKEELINLFSFERVNKAGARLDSKKLKWYNATYLRKKPVSELYSFIDTKGVIYDEYRIPLIVKAAIERAEFSKDLNSAVTYFFEKPEINPDLILNVEFITVMNSFLNDVMIINWGQENIHGSLHKLVEKSGFKLGKVMTNLRHALCGTKPGPELPLIMYILGEQETKERIRHILAIKAPVLSSDSN